MPKFLSEEARQSYIAKRRAKKEGTAMEEVSQSSSKFSREFYLDRKDAAEECGLTQYAFRQIVDELGVGECPPNQFCRYTKRDLVQVRGFKSLMDDLEMGFKDTLKVQRAIAKRAARKKTAEEEGNRDAGI